MMHFWRLFQTFALPCLNCTTESAESCGAEAHKEQEALKEK